jgi:hypothetical protein
MKSVMILLGLLLLMPGFCTLIFAAKGHLGDLMGMWVITLPTSALGVYLLYKYGRQDGPAEG